MIRKLLIIGMIIVACMTMVACSNNRSNDDVMEIDTVKSKDSLDVEVTTVTEIREDVEKTKVSEQPQVIPVKQLADIQFEVDVSSIYRETYDGKTTIYTPEFLVDKDVNTAWVEGSDGDGKGEWLYFSSEEPFNLYDISLINGYAKSERLYYRNNRVKEIEIIDSSGKSEYLHLEDNNMNLQRLVVNFEGVTSLKIVVRDIYKGSHYNDLCISELRFEEEIPHVDLSEKALSIVKKLHNDYVGVYKMNSRFYDKDFQLVKKVDQEDRRQWYWVDFELEQSGNVSREVQIIDYWEKWHMSDDMIVTKSEYITRYYLPQGHMIYKKVSTEDMQNYNREDIFSANEIDTIVYEGYEKE